MPGIPTHEAVLVISTLLPAALLRIDRVDSVAPRCDDEAPVCEEGRPSDQGD